MGCRIIAFAYLRLCLFLGQRELPMALEYNDEDKPIMQGWIWSRKTNRIPLVWSVRIVLQKLYSRRLLNLSTLTRLGGQEDDLVDSTAVCHSGAKTERWNANWPMRLRMDMHQAYQQAIIASDFLSSAGCVLPEQALFYHSFRQYVEMQRVPETSSI